MAAAELLPALAATGVGAADAGEAAAAGLARPKAGDEEAEVVLAATEAPKAGAGEEAAAPKALVRDAVAGAPAAVVVVTAGLATVKEAKGAAAAAVVVAGLAVVREANGDAAAAVVAAALGAVRDANGEAAAPFAAPSPGCGAPKENVFGGSFVFGLSGVEANAGAAA